MAVIFPSCLLSNQNIFLHSVLQCSLHNSLSISGCRSVVVCGKEDVTRHPTAGPQRRKFLAKWDMRFEVLPDIIFIIHSHKSWFWMWHKTLRYPAWEITVQIKAELFMHAFGCRTFNLFYSFEFICPPGRYSPCSMALKIIWGKAERMYASEKPRVGVLHTLFLLLVHYVVVQKLLCRNCAVHYRK